MNWSLVYTKQARKDARKIASSNLKPQAQRLLDILHVYQMCKIGKLNYVAGAEIPNRYLRAR